MQVLGSLPRRGRPGGVLLGTAQLGDRLGETREPGDQHCQDQRVIAGDGSCGGHPPGRLPQARARRRRTGNPGVRRPGGPLVTVCRLPQHAAAQDGGRDVQRVDSRPRGVRCLVRAGPGEQPDLPGRSGGGLRRVIPDRAPFPGREPAGPGAAGLPAPPQPGPGQVGRELPAAVPDRLPGTGGV
jgi:hypothetical protein